jgi:hypothetical protein
MNFNPGKEAARLADHTSDRRPALDVAPVSHAMKDERMKARVTQRHLPLRRSGGISVLNGFKVFLNAF